MCVGDARIRGTRYTVLGLVEWKRLGLSDERILEHHPDLTPADLQAAWWYYQTHKDEIEQALREEEEEALSEDGLSRQRSFSHDSGDHLGSGR